MHVCRGSKCAGCQNTQIYRVSEYICIYANIPACVVGLSAQRGAHERVRPAAQFQTISRAFLRRCSGCVGCRVGCAGV